MSSLKKKLPKKKALYLAWKRGLLNFLLLPHQHDLYEIVANSTKLKTVINCSRRYGKTSVFLIYAMVFMAKNPNSLVRFAAPTAKALKKIVIPIMRQLLETCPEELRPKFNQTEMVWKWWNGSELHMAGCDETNAENLRGMRCDLGFVDEAGFCGGLFYVLNSILVPQTLTTGGRILIASTPPEEADSEFYHLCQEAQKNDAYFIRTIYDNTSISKETLEKYAVEAGGKESITFQREYLCKFVTETNRLLIPEWKDSYIQEREPDEFRQYYHNYVAMDMGVVNDLNAIVFAYYDFRKAQLVVVDETSLLNQTTQDIVDIVRIKEKQLFINNLVYRRIADNNNPQLMQDLTYLHNLPFVPTTKENLEPMINEMRIFVGAGRLIVTPNCKNTIGNLKHGCWDKNRMKFANSKTWHHYDFLAALMYLIRNLDQSTNPIPKFYGKNEYTHFINPQEEQISKNGEELTKVFNI